MMIWVWVNTYRYIFSGMNIHLPAILGFTRYQGFDPLPSDDLMMFSPAGSQEVVQRKGAMAISHLVAMRAHRPRAVEVRKGWEGPEGPEGPQVILVKPWVIRKITGDFHGNMGEIKAEKENLERI